MNNGKVIVQGRGIGSAELDQIRALIGAQAEASRYRLSRVLCEAWAARLSHWLVRADRRRQRCGQFSERQFKRALARDHALLRSGRRLHPRGQGTPSDPARKIANLLDRLQDFDPCVLAFLFDPDVPFTNNQAEQDIRMIKVRQKISGGFRTLRGAQAFARVRSYLSSCRKQGRNLWEAVRRAVIGQPFMPELTTAGP